MLSEHRKAMVTGSVGLLLGALSSQLIPIRSPGPPLLHAAPESNDADVVGLEGRLAELETQVHRMRSEPADTEVVGNESARQVNIDERHQLTSAEREQFWNAELAAHEREPPDPVWSDVAAHSIESDLFGLSGDGQDFEVLQVACRTTTCSADIEWPSRDFATASLTKLVTHRYSYNCQRGIFLQEGTERPYRAKLLLNCPAASRERGDGFSEAPGL